MKCDNDMKYCNNEVGDVENVEIDNDSGHGEDDMNRKMMRLGNKKK